MNNLNLKLHDYNNKSDLESYLENSDKKNLKNPHTKMLNNITNYIYSIKDLSIKEKYIFLFVYDFKAQQKYEPGMIINNQFLAKVLGLSKSEVSKSLKKLSEKNILSYKYIIDQKFLIPNEDITSWKVENSQDKLVKIETMRIFMAKRNVQLRDSYQDMLKKKEAILEQSKCAMIKLKTSL